MSPANLFTVTCHTKWSRSGFTEVALNSVLEENAASAIDFEWEFYSPNKNIYEQCICCVSRQEFLLGQPTVHLHCMIDIGLFRQSGCPKSLLT